MREQYGQIIDDEENAIEYRESLVVNITDEPVTFTIATQPGTAPRRYKLAPFGRSMSSIHLQDGYTRPYKGAGRGTMAPIVERLTMRHVYPGGPRLPQVVHEEQAEQARAKWLAALAAKPTPTRRMALEIDVPAHLDPDRMVARSKPATSMIGEEVGHEPIEPPHPADVDALEAEDDAPVIPAAPATEAEVPLRGSSRGGRRG